jgi:hypothetical protein
MTGGLGSSRAVCKVLGTVGRRGIVVDRAREPLKCRHANGWAAAPFLSSLGGGHAAGSPHVLAKI